MTRFAHLHLHTNRSFFDGLSPVEDLVEKAANLGQPGMAVTEHGNLFSAAQFVAAAKKHGIKPVIGMEAYEAVPHEWDSELHADILKRDWDSGQRRYFHLTLWVMDSEGWRNLSALHTQSFTASFKPKNQPLIDRASLERHAGGLAVGLGCIQSRTNTDLMNNDPDAAYEAAKWYVDVFGPDRVYLEVMANTDEQQRLLREQRKLAKRLGVSTVATNDVHYRDREDGVQNGPHHVLVQARRWRKKDTEQSEDKSDAGFGQWYGSDGFYLKSAAEMLATGGLEPQELDITCELLDKVSFDFSSLGKPAPPVAPVPQPGDDPAFDRWLALAT